MLPARRSRRSRGLIPALLGVSLLSTAFMPSAAASAAPPAIEATSARIGPFELISQTPEGTGGDHRSALPSVSNNGRYVGFESSATDLVDIDTNGDYQTYVRDRRTATTELLSTTPEGAAGNDSSWPPELSATGRYAVFASDASDLVPGDTGTYQDVFLVDRSTGLTTIISRGIGDVPADGSSYHPGVSDDGRFVVFMSAASNLTREPTFQGVDPYDVFVRDMTTGTTTLMTRGVTGGTANSRSNNPEITGDGRYIVFDSLASNLVVDDTNGQSDVFRLDRTTGTVTAISRTPGGSTADGNNLYPAVSDDGRFVTYQSTAPDLVPLPPIEYQRDVYLFDAADGSTALVSHAPDGTRADGTSVHASIAPNGRFVVFTSVANIRPRSLPDHQQLNAYRYRVTTQENRFITPPIVDGDSYNGFEPAISSSGFAVFESQNDLTDQATPSYNEVYGSQTMRRR